MEYNVEIYKYVLHEILAVRDLSGMATVYTYNVVIVIVTTDKL